MGCATSRKPNTGFIFNKHRIHKATQNKQAYLLNFAPLNCTSYAHTLQAYVCWLYNLTISNCLTKTFQLEFVSIYVAFI